MCLGIPMQATEDGEGWIDCAGRGERRRVRTALVGPLAAGDWVLVHLDSAIERIAPQRAAEVNEALDLLEAALGGEAARAAGLANFALPSAMSAEELARLTGQTAPGRAPD